MKTSMLLVLASASMALASPTPKHIALASASTSIPPSSTVTAPLNQLRKVFNAIIGRAELPPYPNTTPDRCPISSLDDLLAPDVVFKISEVDLKVHPLAWVDSYIHVRRELHTILEFNIPEEWVTNKRKCSLFIRTPSTDGMDKEFKIFNNGSMGFNVLEPWLKVNPLIQEWSDQPRPEFTLGKVPLENPGTLWPVGSFPCPDVRDGRWNLRLNSEDRLDVIIPQTNNSRGNKLPTGVFLSSCEAPAAPQTGSAAHPWF